MARVIKGQNALRRQFPPLMRGLALTAHCQLTATAPAAWQAHATAIAMPEWRLERLRDTRGQLWKLALWHRGYAPVLCQCGAPRAFSLCGPRIQWELNE